MAVYAVSDLHGMYELYEKICAKLNPEDKVIFLGDAGDRGPEGWKLIRAILDNPQWIYLKGNHEDMLVKAIAAIQNYEDADFEPYDVRLSKHNGGEATIEACLKDNEGFEIIEKLAALPLVYHYYSPSGVEYCCTHAGYSPIDETGFPPSNKYKLLWDRDHMYDSLIFYIKDFYIIHGHTPVDYMYDFTHDGDFMDRKYNSPYLYGEGMKINIDAGAFYTYQTFLFNLDEFSFEVIECEDKPNEKM